MFVFEVMSHHYDKIDLSKNRNRLFLILYFFRPLFIIGITVRLHLFRTDRRDPVELLDRAAWVPYYLLTEKIIGSVAVDLSEARVKVCVAARSLSPHR